MLYDPSGTKIASQNRSDQGGRKRARNHSAAEIARFFASAAATKSLAASDFLGLPQNRWKLAATTAASRRSRAILRPQRPRDTKSLTFYDILLGKRQKSGVRKRVVSKRVVLADVPSERKPERGYVRQNHPFGNRPLIS